MERGQFSTIVLPFPYLSLGFRTCESLLCCGGIQSRVEVSYTLYYTNMNSLDSCVCQCICMNIHHYKLSRVQYMTQCVYMYNVCVCIYSGTRTPLIGTHLTVLISGASLIQV